MPAGQEKRQPWDSQARRTWRCPNTVAATSWPVTSSRSLSRDCAWSPAMPLSCTRKLSVLPPVRRMTWGGGRLPWAWAIGRAVKVISVGVTEKIAPPTRNKYHAKPTSKSASTAQTPKTMTLGGWTNN